MTKDDCLYIGKMETLDYIGISVGLGELKEKLTRVEIGFGLWFVPNALAN